MKRYIIPQTLVIQVQPQALLTNSVQFVIDPGQDMGSGEMKIKARPIYDVWEDESMGNTFQ